MQLTRLCAFLLGVIPYISVAAGDRQPDGPKVADYFYDAPFSVASQLDRLNRLDMVDYFTHGSSVKSDNRLGRKVGLTDLSEDMISWQDQDSVVTTLVMFPAPRNLRVDTLLMVIRTVTVPMPDSEINFYDNHWRRLNYKGFKMPSLADWLAVNDKSLYASASEAFPFMLVTASYEPEDKVLVLTNRMSDFFVESDRPEVLSFLKSELRYRWTGSNFKLVEK